MENIEVHSKNFVIRWVHAGAHTQITWNVLPTKRSINFGVFTSGDESSLFSGHQLSEASGPLRDRLESAGFESLLPDGLVRIEAKEVTEGRLVLDKARMLGFVFDNTFSISNSKLVRFAFNVEPVSPGLGSSGVTSASSIDLPPAGNDSHASSSSDAALAAAAANASLYGRSSVGSDGHLAVPHVGSPTGSPTFSPTVPHDSLSSSAAFSALSSSSQQTTTGVVRKGSFSRAAKDLTGGRRRRGTISSTNNGSTIYPYASLPSSNSVHSITGNAPAMNDSNGTLNTLDDDSASVRVRHRQGTISSTHTTSNGNSSSENEPMRSLDGRFLTGFLLKKRRKQFQGFARRYFSLDKRNGLLNYYLNNRSSSLRGVMPVRMSEIKRDPKNPIIYLNSGMEKWVLKSHDHKAFEVWWTELKEVQSAGRQDESELDSEDDIVNQVAPPASLSDLNGVGGGSGSKEDTPVANGVGFVGGTPGSGIDLKNVDGLAEKMHAAFPALKQLRSSISEMPTGSQRAKVDSAYVDFLKELGSRFYQMQPQASHQSSSNLHGQADNLKEEFNPRKTFRRSPISQATIKASKSQTHKYKEHLLQQIKSRNFAVITIVSMLVGAAFGFSHVLVFFLMLIGAVTGGFIQFTRPGSVGFSGDIIADHDVFADAYSGSTGIHGGPEDLDITKIYNENGDEIGSIVSGSHGVGGSDEDDDFDLSDGSDEEYANADSDSKARDPEHGTVSYVPQRPVYNSATSSAMSEQYDTARKQGGDQIWASEDPDIAAVFTKLAEEHRKSAAAAAAAEGKEGRSPEAATGDSAQGEVSQVATRQVESAETSLYPLPHEVVRRRKQITGPAQPPPSLLALLKNAKSGNASAPIISNEPLSGVESVAEIFENSDLLAAASKAPPKSELRVMLVALFSVARMSSVRCKERILRKPFTPLLGETYEMVREDREFRFVAEKVMHKPEVIASQAESPHWTVHFTSRPHSKLWAKSMQLSDVGSFNVTFPDGEGLSFNNPELFVRNIIGGERYVEPVGTVTVESNAAPHLVATIEFKSGGMFSGRSEEVKITCGKMVYEGKWTEAIYHKSKVVWAAKPLVENPTKHYGWTVFASQLNEITPIERDQLPPNDSRLRPDLRLYESQSNVEKAEEIKLTLEQHQRERRKKLEDAQKQHEPFFFVKSKDSKGLYVLRKGERNYWVQRQKKEWGAIPNYFE